MSAPAIAPAGSHCAHRRRLLAVAAVAASVLGAVLPAAAPAGTVSTQRQTDVIKLPPPVASDQVIYRAAAGERNVVTFEGDRSTVIVRDSAGVIAGPGCSQPDVSDRTTARCEFGAGQPALLLGGLTLIAELGDLDDVLLAASVALPLDLRVDGGAGEDMLRGGAAADTLVGGAGDDMLIGGAGIDWFPQGGPGADGSDTIEGGPGQDIVDYARRTGAVTADPDGQPDDGETGERDLIAADVEDIYGGLGADRLATTGAGGLLGGAGDDVLIGGPQSSSLSGGSGNDVLDGGAGEDSLHGGAGDDELVGGSDSDLLDGDRGDDVLRAADRSYDLVLCGPGRDRAIADRRDMLFAGCDHTRRHGRPTVLLGSFDPPGLLHWSAVDDGRMRAGVGCPVDMPRRCRGILKVLYRGRVVGTRAFVVRPGHGSDLSIRVTRSFARIARKRRAQLNVTLLAISREPGGRTQINRLAWLVD